MNQRFLFGLAVFYLLIQAVSASAQSSCTPHAATLYLNGSTNSTTCGLFTVQLSDLGQPNSNGVAPADFNIYYSNVLTNTTQVAPGSHLLFNVTGSYLTLYVNSTFDGLYSYQKWAAVFVTPSYSAPTTTTSTTSSTSSSSTTSVSTTVTTVPYCYNFEVTAQTGGQAVSGQCNTGARTTYAVRVDTGSSGAVSVYAAYVSNNSTIYRNITGYSVCGGVQGSFGVLANHTISLVAHPGAGGGSCSGNVYAELVNSTASTTTVSTTTVTTTSVTTTIQQSNSVIKFGVSPSSAYLGSNFTYNVSCTASSCIAAEGYGVTQYLIDSGTATCPSSVPSTAMDDCSTFYSDMSKASFPCYLSSSNSTGEGNTVVSFLYTAKEYSSVTQADNVCGYELREPSATWYMAASKITFHSSTQNTTTITSTSTTSSASTTSSYYTTMPYNYGGSNPNVSSAPGSSCGNFVFATYNLTPPYNGTYAHRYNTTCTWGGGPLSVYLGSGNSGAIAFNVNGASDGKTYITTLVPNESGNNNDSNIWCDSYFTTATLPAQTYNIRMVEGRGGGACGAAFLQLRPQNNVTPTPGNGGQPLAVSAYPELQVISPGQSAYLLSSSFGGVPPYTYKWAELTSSDLYSFLSGSGAHTSTYLFHTDAQSQPGTYHFEVQVQDSSTPATTIISAPVTVVLLPTGATGTVSLNVTSQNTALNITNTESVNLNLTQENSHVDIVPTIHTQNRSTFVVTNATLFTPTAPYGKKKLVALNVSTQAHNITLNFTMHYNCNVSTKRIAPYILQNNTWTRITNYTVNQQNCTISFTLHKDPTVGLLENNTNSTTNSTVQTTQTTSVSPTNTTSAAQSSGNSSGTPPSNNSALYGTVALVVVVLALVVFFVMKRGGKSAPAPVQQQTEEKQSS